MRRASMLVAITMISVAARAADTGASETAIRAVLTSTEVAVNKRDFAALAALYTPDADSIVFDHPKNTGRAAIQKGFETGWTHEPPGCRISIKVDSIRLLSADVAVLDDSASYTGCASTTVGDRATFVLVRREDKWWIVSGRIYQAERRK
jgi:uncharacterized protein (TIGR02246 family)